MKNLKIPCANHRLNQLVLGQATYPGVVTDRVSPAPLSGLASDGACPSFLSPRRIVRSYRTISPLPAKAGGIVSVALSVSSALPRKSLPVRKRLTLRSSDFPPSTTCPNILLPNF